MTEVPHLRFEGFALAPGSTGATFEVWPGDGFALLGRAGSGKTRLLRTIGGQERSPAGRVSVETPLSASELGGAERRESPQTLARRLAGRGGSTGVSEALGQCGLVEVMTRPIRDLSPSQQAACGALALLLAPAGPMIADGVFDRLDPWTLPRVLRAMQTRLEQGVSLICSTHREDVARALGRAIVLGGGGVRFVGAFDELLRQAGAPELEVLTDDPSAARAIAEPLAVRVWEIDGGIAMSVLPGQETAARLLLAGYGSVRLIVERRPRLDEALARLV